ncbi:MAG: radical SAM protein [Nitrospirae bacterium]|nr:MAG: radical SAM protein [Nitrospirota bacterium]
MKVLFIQPPPRQIVREDIVVPPLGIAYLAAVVEAKGHKVSIIDAFAEGLDMRSLEEKIKAISPDLIGITGMTPVIDNAFKVARAARKYAKHIIMGGPHVSVAGNKIFKQCSDIDYAIQGEGETSLPLLIDGLESGKKDIGNVPGLITKEIINPPAQFIADLDNLPFPARHLLPNERYRYILSQGKVTTMFTSRGCPYHCIFCDKAVFGSKWRSRSASNVLDEMEFVNREFKINSIIIYDDLFTVKKERVMEICRGILERGLRIEWKCEGRVNIVEEETLRWMKKAGCSMIAYGVESGNQKGLDYLNKGTKVEQIKKAFELTRKAGIKPMAYFVLGIPVETYEDELRTIEFAKEIRPAYAQFSVLSPTPGTKLYDDAVKMGWYREVDAQNPMDKDIRRPAIINENWDEGKLNGILREAHRRFYLSPWYIFERIKELRSFKEFLIKAGAGLRLLKWYLRRNNA